MDNTFEIPVTFEGDELLFKAKLIAAGFVHKFEVEVNGERIVFEPDEEGKYRAIADQKLMTNGHVADAALIKEIAQVIESVSN